MTQPRRPQSTRPASIYGLTPREQGFAADGRRAAGIAVLVALVVSAAALIVFDQINGRLPLDATPTSATLWGVNPTAWTVCTFAVIAMVVAVLFAFVMTYLENIRVRSVNPLHWAGLISLVTSIAAAAAGYYYAHYQIDWSAYSSLLAALPFWAFLYAGLVPTILDTRWRHEARRRSGR